ncbi:MAG TPA: zf-HC2 domain-containing protein [Acidimicrobiia bacterium]|nr:zf-HC2 domain-containing protein [Acidimicrobiia bacterium]
MNHTEIQDLLEDYVDDRLGRATRKQVDEHLRSCGECRALLDEVAPVEIAALGPTRFDERVMRRTARRSMVRTAYNTLLLLLGVVIVGWLFSAFVFQPLVINRGGRAGDAARATMDVTAMTNPGAVISEGRIQSGLFDRDMAFDAVLQVGSGAEDLGTVQVSLGAFGLSGPEGTVPWPYLGDQDFQDARDQISRLGPGTVTTVQVELVDPITVEQAQDIADDTEHDTRVTWAGFVTDSEGDPNPLAPGGLLGYGTCLDAGQIPDETLEATSAGFGSVPGGAPSSIAGALDSVIAALENLAEHPEWLRHLTFEETDGSELDLVIAELNQNPRVRSLVITGPSDEVARYLADDTAEIGSARVLAIDFYNWSPGVCGR